MWSRGIPAVGQHGESRNTLVQGLGQVVQSPRVVLVAEIHWRQQRSLGGLLKSFQAFPCELIGQLQCVGQLHASRLAARCWATCR